MPCAPDSANLSRTDTSPERSDDGEAAASAAPVLAVVLEADRPDAGSFLVSLEGIDRVVIGRGSERRSQRRGAELELHLPDRRTSKAHAALDREGAGFVLSDLGSSNGTFLGGWGACERVTRAPVDFGQPFRAGHSFLALLRDGGPILRARVGRQWPFPTLSADFARELGRLERVAASAIPIVLLGETGTGKEVLARAVHQRSRRPGPFVAVNCSALPASLVEAQLLGRSKGTSSPAVEDELGFVRAADGGTLFLDEIGDLPASAQASLLGVLQEAEVTPVGSLEPVKVDVRIVSAMRDPLRERVADKSFRADLHARLSGFTFHVPPLRARRLDVGELLASFCREARSVKSLRADAALALLAHDWPMNVRELKQAFEAAAVLAEGGVVRLSDLPAAIARGREQSESSAAPAPSPADAALRDELAARLEASGHNLSQVAREMGKARQQVQRWVKRFGLGPR